MGGVFRVWIKLSSEARGCFIAKDSALWIRHLTDTTSDWATNLVLYYLSQEHAGAFNLLYKDRKSWLPYKEGAIAGWKDWLHKWKTLTQLPRLQSLVPSYSTKPIPANSLITR